MDHRREATSARARSHPQGHTTEDCAPDSPLAGRAPAPRARARARAWRESYARARDPAGAGAGGLASVSARIGHAHSLWGETFPKMALDGKLPGGAMAKIRYLRMPPARAPGPVNGKVQT